MSEDLIGAILGRAENDVISASIIYLVATKRFFVLCEAVPGVILIIGGGDTPKIINFKAFLLGVNDSLNKQNRAGSEFSMFVIGSRMSVEASI